jgi:serine/threonine protein phosphatase 1
VIECLLEQQRICSTEFLRGNHEVMILDARESFLKADIWMSYGGLETVLSYGAGFTGDWESAIPATHWGFLENTRPYAESSNHIFVHACLDPDLDLPDQPDWLLYWEYFDKIQPHKSGKRIICGHPPQRSAKIKDLGFAACIDPGPASGGWLTCLDTLNGDYWQANEKGSTRTGSLPATP